MRRAREGGPSISAPVTSNPLISPASSGAPAAAVVETHALTKRWGTTVALEAVDIAVPPGITGLLGANGAGKTTLLGLALGLHQPDSGRVTVMGEDVATAGPRVRARVGYAPEHRILPDDMSAGDLVRHIAQLHGLPAGEASARASDALWLVGLGEERLRPIGTLSTGQRQRVKLAQAIAHDPDLVLLDEPTEGLDPMQRDQMLALIRRVGAEFGISILLSSHVLSEVEQTCDHAVILFEGRLVAAGPVAELTAGGGGTLLEVDGDREGVARRLRAAGIEVAEDEAGLLLGHLDDGALDAIRDALAAAGAGLRRLEPRRARLEDLFLDLEARR